MRDDDLPAGLGEISYGRIASVDLAAGRVTVDIGDVVTQPIRWLSGAAGKVRLWLRPVIGESVMILAPEGDIAGAVAVRGLDCDAFPPLGDPDRDLIRFGDGAVVAYDDARHHLDVVLPAGATVNLVAPGGVKLDCDVRITGDLQVDKDVKAGTISLRDHVHLGVQPGGGQSQKPKP